MLSEGRAGGEGYHRRRIDTLVVIVGIRLTHKGQKVLKHQKYLLKINDKLIIHPSEILKAEREFTNAVVITMSNHERVVAEDLGCYLWDAISRYSE